MTPPEAFDILNSVEKEQQTQKIEAIKAFKTVSEIIRQTQDQIKVSKSQVKPNKLS